MVKQNTSVYVTIVLFQQLMYLQAWLHSNKPRPMFTSSVPWQKTEENKDKAGRREKHLSSKWCWQLSCQALNYNYVFCLFGLGNSRGGLGKKMCELEKERKDRKKEGEKDRDCQKVQLTNSARWFNFLLTPHFLSGLLYSAARSEMWLKLVSFRSMRMLRNRNTEGGNGRRRARGG